MAPSRVFDPAPPRKDEEEEDLTRSQGCEFNSDSELEVIEAGGAVLQGGEESGSSVEGKGGAQSSVPDFNVEKTVVHHPTYQVARGVLRFPARERCTTTLATTWAEVASGPTGRDPQVSSGRGTLVPSGRGWLRGRGTLVSGGRVMLLTSGRGTLAPSHVGAQQASTTSLHSSTPELGRAWEKRGCAVRKMVSQRTEPPTKTSEESSEIAPMRVTISLKHGDQTKLDNPKESEDRAGNSDGQDQENSDAIPSRMPLTSQELRANRENQAAGEQEASSHKKKTTVVRAKGGNRPTYTVAAAAGDLSRSNPRKKMTHEKKFPETDSSVMLGRIFPPWGQRIKAPHQEAASLPPISCVPVFRNSKSSSSSLSPGPKQSKQDGTLRRSRTWRRRETQTVAREDDELNRDPVLQAQLSTYRPGPPYLLLHRGELSSGDARTRAPYISQISQPLPQRQRSITPRGFAPSGDQEPLTHATGPEMSQQPSGEQGCPRCPVLQKEIEKLKDQLAAIQFLNEKFQSFGV
ncbi:PREDICTED: uncharacterized protein CXorf49 homolog [Dipodomys ordii]|uniref:Uncharacterized protein CXorf49 homolog n=1 Tax=Dipodomys ordii TaxID=10020 RepID=A0A1S3GGD8_DIPOR|nr:PREDICTED: uncharacterized protein CXorf49 homolog [Dipodomys ordii]